MVDIAGGKITVSAKYYLLILVIQITVTILVSVFARHGDPLPPDSITVRLCRQYAERDHEKEFTPERWELVKDMWTTEQWYGSCIDHSTGGWYTFTHGTSGY